MAEKNIRKYLHDVLPAIEGIESFSHNFSMPHLDIIRNKWALERGLSIIGEVLYKARNLNQELPVTDLNAIIATRHIVVHDYDLVDSARMLIIVTKHLPVLKNEILAILQTPD